MRRKRTPRLRLLHLLIPAALLVMLIGVACGGAEQTTDTDTGAGAADSSTGAAAGDSDSGAAGATATPLPQSPPVSAAQSGEGRRLVVLTESFGNEVWDPKYEGGDKHLWHFPIHSHLITTSDDLQFTKDGLATDWRVSDDGLTMTWTIRDDAVFHNGDPVTADDAAWYQRYVLDDAARSVVRIRIWRLIAADEPNAAYEADNTDQ